MLSRSLRLGFEDWQVFAGRVECNQDPRLEHLNWNGNSTDGRPSTTVFTKMLVQQVGEFAIATLLADISLG